MGRIETAFDRCRQRGVPALVPFITAGDPSLEQTAALVAALEEAGADVIELGFPFSDPMADGPVIQAASERALQAGTTLEGVLALVKRIRTHSALPIVLMGYYNPVLIYGPERFAREATAAGVDGLLLVDLPPEEAEELRRFTAPAGLPLITLVAPTTPPARRQQLAGEAEGYLYYVSMTGVTGTSRIDADAIRTEVETLKGLSKVPVAVGFGVATPEDAARVGSYADGVVVGSALVKIIATYGSSPELTTRAGDFIRSLRAGLDRSGR